MKKQETIRAMLEGGLAGGRPLFAGRASEVAALVLAKPKRAFQLIECLWDEDLEPVMNFEERHVLPECSKPA